MTKISLLVTVLAPYGLPRFRALQRLRLFDMEVLALGRSVRDRDWNVPVDSLDFPYTEALTNQCVDDHPKRTAKRALVAYLNKRDPEVVVVQGYGEGALRAGVIWAIRSRKTVILVSMSTMEDRRRFMPLEWAKSLLIRSCDACFVAGKRSRAYMRRLGMPADRIWVGHNVVDNEWFTRKADETRRRSSALRKQYGLPASYFLYVGRLAREKNLFRLLEAYKESKDKAGHTWGLVLVGGGPEEDSLKSHAENHGLTDVVWAGSRQIEELPVFYALAKCLVLPSLSETWGLVINEAMACGLPVLVSEKCGCVPELLQPEQNGYCFDPLDVDQLARFMERVASGRPDLKAMGAESRRIIQDFTPEAWAHRLAKCISQTVAMNEISR